MPSQSNRPFVPRFGSADGTPSPALYHHFHDVDSRSGSPTGSGDSEDDGYYHIPSAPGLLLHFTDDSDSEAHSQPGTHSDTELLPLHVDDSQDEEAGWSLSLDDTLDLADRLQIPRDVMIGAVNRDPGHLASVQARFLAILSEMVADRAASAEVSSAMEQFIALQLAAARRDVQRIGERLATLTRERDDLLRRMMELEEISDTGGVDQ